MTTPPPRELSTPRMQSQRIVELIAHGEAVSRSELTKALGLSPSTIGLRVADLEQRGVIVEEGVGTSSGGRRPRILRLRENHDYVYVAELGGRHARIARVEIAGELRNAQTIDVHIDSGPEATLAFLKAALLTLPFAGESDQGKLLGVGLALPGPVDIGTGGVRLPSRMPGWQDFAVRDWLEREFDVPAIVDNDANLIALGEHHAQFGTDEHSITVKTGTAIGSGIVVNGALYRGATGAAGDVTHTRISAGAAEPCSCGNVGCLETLASGAALVRQLRAQGVDVTTTADVIALARDAHPLATTLVRTAGTYLGEVLSSIVNFFNPDAVFLSGGMASCEPFIAAVRSAVYEGCHPLATQKLRIESAKTGPDAGLHGAIHLLRERISLTALSSASVQ